MNFCRLSVLLTIICLATLSPDCGDAALDEMHARVAQQVDSSLRWDNIEPGSVWLQGPRPAYHKTWRMHVLTLNPGESATVQMASRRYFRAFHPEQQLTSSDVEIAVSNGSGLEFYHPLPRSQDRHSMIYPPSTNGPYLVHLKRGHQHLSSIQIAVFQSRQSLPRPLVSYQKLYPLDAPSVRLRAWGTSASEQFWKLASDKPMQLEIVGPTRLMFSTRLIIPPSSRDLQHSYRIYTRLNGNASTLLDYMTSPQMSPPMYRDGVIDVVGQLDENYLNIPSGTHTLQFQASSSLYVRLQGQEAANYLAPRVNRADSLLQSDKSDALNWFVNTDSGSIWELDDAAIQSAVTSRDVPLSLQERVAMRLIRDNRYPDGGLSGAHLLKQAARQHPNYPKVRQAADKLMRRATRYRDLLPSQKRSQKAQYTGVFLRPRLQRVGDSAPRFTILDRHQDALLKQLSRAVFTSLPDSSDRQTYVLPVRTSPSELRLVVDTTSLTNGGDLWLQYDDQPPIRVRVVANSARSLAVTRPTLAEIGLSLLERPPLSPQTVTLDGVFSAQRYPARFLRVGTGVVPLPVDVKRVTLTSVSTGTSLAVALQYRVSTPYRLSETAYWRRVSRLQSSDVLVGLLRQQLKQLQNGPPTFEPFNLVESSAFTEKLAATELVNDWLPTLRFLRSSSRRLTTGVTAVHPKPPIADSLSVKALKSQAEQAESSEDWVTALALRTRLLHATTGPLRRQAELARVDLLSKMGEDHLEDQILRGMYLFSSDAALRDQAFARLERRYAEARDATRLRSLLATAVIRHPRALLLRRLVAQLVESGHAEHALKLGLVLPPAEQPTAALIQAALQIGWYETAERLAAQLSSDVESQFWLGYLAHLKRDDEAALRHLRKAGPQGQSVAQALLNGEVIRGDLTSPDATIWATAVHAWEAWQAAHPGTRVWRHRPQLLADYAGAVALVEPSRNTQVSWYKSEPQRPVALRFYGPIRLRLEARPLHPHLAAAPVDGWMHIRDGDQLRLVPITQNRAAPHLQTIPGALSSGGTPGGRVSDEFKFGPGLHEVTVASPSMVLLVRVLTNEPVLPLRTLPFLTPDTIRIGSYSSGQASPSGSSTAAPAWRCHKCVAVLPDQADLGSGWVRPSNRNMDEFVNLVAIHPLSPWAEPPVMLAPSAQSYEDYVQELQAARSLSRGNIDQALMMPNPDDPQSIRRYMTRLAWLAEQQPKRLPEALSRAHSLHASYPHVSGLARLYARIARTSVWQPMMSVQHSAGLRYVPVQGWVPESPTQRLRRALLTPVRPDEHILSGSGGIVLALENVQATRLLLSFKVEELGYLPPEPLKVWYQVQDDSRTSLQLRAGETRVIRVDVPSGRHTVRVHLDDPVSNQFLRLQVKEVKSGLKQVLMRSAERPYHVATHTEPIELFVLGPSWLRLDEWQEGRLQTRYRQVAEGWQTIQIRPEPQRAEALVRIHQRVLIPQPEVLRRRDIAMVPDPALEPLVQLASRRASPFVLVRDDYPLGQQEDGTLSFRGQFVSRSTVQEDTRLDMNERYWEFSATHRYYDASRRLYYETEGLGRGRHDGGPTFGLSERLDYRPHWSPFAFSLIGKAFAQLPASGAPFAATASLEAGVSWGQKLGRRGFHRPSISWFGRVLSRNSVEASSGRVDRDVFSDYKAAHRAGLKLSESLIYRPWLDTLWSARVSLVSNQALNLLDPDRLSLRFQWKQLLGAFQINGAYRYAHFFADDDRDTSLNRHTLSLEGLWEYWKRSQHRLDVRLRFRYDPVTTDIGFLLGVSWHLGSGRGYRDFRPGSIDFRNLRKYRIPQALNNQLNHGSNPELETMSTGH